MQPRTGRLLSCKSNQPPVPADRKRYGSIIPSVTIIISPVMYPTMYKPIYKTHLPTLKAIAESPGKFESEVVTESDFHICKSLHNENYITGTIGPTNQHEHKNQVADLRLTTSGRLFYESLLKLESESKPLSRAVNYAKPIIAYILGLLTPVIVELLKRTIGLDTP